MHCFTSPSRYDVVLNDSIGKGQIKVAGAAQRRTKYGILHQGSIALNMLEPSCTLRAHAKIPCLGKVQGREQQSIVPKARSETRITDDIASKRKRFTKSLLSAFTQELNINFIDFQPSPNFLFSSKRLSEGKYATEKWNRHRKG
jgi:lipoate-protein ligase A